MKKLIIKLAVVAVVLLIAAIVVSMFFLGSIVKKGVERVGPSLTKTEMKLDGATLSLFSGTGSLKGFMLGNPEGFKTAAAVRVGTTSIGIRPGSVFGDKVHVTHIRVEAPEITFESQGLNVRANNLSKILENVKAATTGAAGGTPADKPADRKAGGEGAVKKLQVDDFLIAGSKLRLSSTILGGQEFTVPLPDIHFSNLGQGPDGITAAELTERILAEVTAVALKAAEKAIAEGARGATRDVTEAAKNLGKDSNSLEKVTKGVGDLLRKK